MLDKITTFHILFENFWDDYYHTSTRAAIHHATLVIYTWSCKSMYYLGPCMTLVIDYLKPICYYGYR